MQALPDWARQLAWGYAGSIYGAAMLDWSSC